jgi:hypothetical protein
MRHTAYQVIIGLLLLLLFVQYSGSCAPAASSSEIAALAAQIKALDQKVSNVEAQT